MRVLIASVFAFLGGAIGGWLATMGFYLGYLAVTGARDHDGGGAMAYGLVIGPVIAIVLGAAAAVGTALRMTRDPQRSEVSRSAEPDGRPVRILLWSCCAFLIGLVPGFLLFVAGLATITETAALALLLALATGLVMLVRRRRAP